MKLLLVVVVAVVAVVAKASAQEAQNNPDKNGNGFIEKDEAGAMFGDTSDKCWKAMLKKADTDGDGKISMAEIMAARAGGPPTECNMPDGGDGGDGKVDEPAPENNKVPGGASSMKAALSLLGLLAAATRLF